MGRKGLEWVDNADLLGCQRVLCTLLAGVSELGLSETAKQFVESCECFNIGDIVCLDKKKIAPSRLQEINARLLSYGLEVGFIASPVIRKMIADIQVLARMRALNRQRRERMSVSYTHLTLPTNREV